MAPADEPLRLVVDGEVFDVRTDADQPGVYHYDWVSGRHRYGFSAASPDRAESRAGHEDAIRGFLAQINPATGYID